MDMGLRIMLFVFSCVLLAFIHLMLFSFLGSYHANSRSAESKTGYQILWFLKWMINTMYNNAQSFSPSNQPANPLPYPAPYLGFDYQLRHTKAQ